jgi:hypothetical protein
MNRTRQELLAYAAGLNIEKNPEGNLLLYLFAGLAEKEERRFEATTIYLV